MRLGRSAVAYEPAVLATVDAGRLSGYDDGSVRTGRKAWLRTLAKGMASAVSSPTRAVTYCQWI